MGASSIYKMAKKAPQGLCQGWCGDKLVVSTTGRRTMPWKSDPNRKSRLNDTNFIQGYTYCRRKNDLHFRIALPQTPNHYENQISILSIVALAIAFFSIAPLAWRTT